LSLHADKGTNFGENYPAYQGFWAGMDLEYVLAIGSTDTGILGLTPMQLNPKEQSNEASNA